MRFVEPHAAGWTLLCAWCFGFVSLASPHWILTAEGHADTTPTTGFKPNVLLIITDDMNTALGCYDQPQVKSPHIDRLAARGIRFDRAYCQAPVCNPTRASLFSGLLPETIGVLDNETAWPRQLKALQYLPQYFHSQGYFTATIGKVLDHKRVPKQPFWDLEIPEWGKIPDEDQIAERGELSSGGSRFWAVLNALDDATADGDVARRAVATLTSRAGQQQPLFLAVGFRRPHTPYAAPRRYFDLYAAEEISLPHTPADHFESILPAAKNGYTLPRDRALQAIRAYYACISFVDAQVGALLDALDRLNLWQDTIVVFVSDHGYHTGHHGMWHKETLFEQSSRAPLIVAAPGKPRGAVCRRVVELLDLYPTLTHLCGLPTPEALEGASLVPLLDDPQRPWKRPALTVEARIDDRKKQTVLGRSIRTEQFRYTQWNDGRSGVELYDHGRDPDEFVNLARQPVYAETVARLRELLRSRPAKDR